MKEISAQMSGTMHQNLAILGGSIINGKESLFTNRISTHDFLYQQLNILLRTQVAYLFRQIPVDELFKLSPTYKR